MAACVIAREASLFTLVDRMLAREVLKTLLAIMVVLLLLILANLLVKLLGEVAAGEMSLALMLAFFGAKVIKMVGFIAPPAFFFAILWVLGQMYRNSEMVAVQAAGWGARRLYRPFFWVALLLALGVGALTLHFYPQAKARTAQLAEQEKAAVRVGGLRAGGFTEFADGRFMVYAGSVDAQGERLGDLFVRYERNGRSGVLLAGQAAIERTDEGRFLVLYEGHRYDGVPGREGFSIGRFERYGIRMPDPQVRLGRMSHDTLPLSVLLAADDRRSRTELQWRLAAPMSVFALMLMSVPLARSMPRQGVYGRLILAVIFYALYMNLLRLAQAWMKQGTTPEWLGIWWVPAGAALTAMLLLTFDSMAVRGRWRRWWSRG